MHTVAIRLDPARLQNADADIRYAIPDLLAKRSAGTIIEEGYDYVGPNAFLVLVFTTADLEAGLRIIDTVIRTEIVLGNSLADAAVVAVQEGEAYRITYPSGYSGEFYETETGA